ncbi:MAG: hypothetical protein SFX73_17575, partial [Kofleriaceae bacterium]|nr:hypothetical protein [Kofleriaceae bacterium]
MAEPGLQRPGIRAAACYGSARYDALAPDWCRPPGGQDPPSIALEAIAAVEELHGQIAEVEALIYADDAHGLRFELLPVPTNAEVLAILDRLMRRIARRRASLANADGVDEDAGPDVLAQVQADAATTWRSSTETRATV